jgi:subtilase family serine protease
MRRFPTLLLAASLAMLPCHLLAQSMMSHHVRDAIRNGQAQHLGQLQPDQILNLDIVLPLRNQAALDSFLADLYDPTSANYRHFLTVAEFTARFGPSQKDYDDVLNFARLNGFQVTGGSRDGMDVQVRGPVSAAERAFHVHMRTFRHPNENRTFFGPDSEPVTDLPFNLWHISGLDNYSIPRPLVVKKSDYAQANGIDANAVVSHATTGSGPAASFLGSDMRSAYYGSGPLIGTGQNLGLLEFLGTDLDDLNTYYKNVNQTNNVPITLLSVDGTSVNCTKAGGNCDDTEQTLDMTQALGMAPGLASLTMYIGSSDTAIISAMTTNNPLPTTIGCSWGWTPVDPNALDPYFKKMAAQGQTFFAASGDSSTWSRRNQSWPADDPYIVSVGGTDLVTSGAAGPWASETAWVDSGGGITPNNIAIPSWQQLSGVITSANKGSTTLRNGPDVSANANFTFYTCANQTTCLANTYGGTSFAAPMWAAYLALANQQMATKGQAPLGFINPTIYAQNVTSSYSTNFHDITSGTSGSYSAVTGYDLVTGWGSPNAGLIDALTGSSTGTQAFTISASPTALSVTAGNSGSSTITTAVSGGFDASVVLSASGAPSGVTVSFSPSTIAAPGSGNSTATFTVASFTTPGTYSITITGTGGGLTQTTTVSLTVAAAAQPAFTLSASPGSITLKRNTPGSITVTTAVSGGFNANIKLSASGQGGAQTVTFSPSTIAAPGSGQSIMNITTGRNAAQGTRTITITATGGGITHTTTITLTVTK